ncbi:MAG TPA: hypothetical protein VL728_09625 [Cyclobacteriaceae bacterium]|nr:hypothetical protein [Cyclobacteriaceae bacterium]
MRKIVVLLTVMLFATTVSFGKRKQPAPEFVKILHSKNQTLFMKVHKFFVGGTVEVYSADRKFLESDYLPHPLTKVFFDEAPKGSYIIKVTKGKMSFEFIYINS